MPKVTAIIPVYNVEPYIERCAISLFEQTFDDIEYIFVNDCTPDSSIEILKKVMEDYPGRKVQCRIIDHPENLGLPTARKTGVLNATGDYIIHCDSDDWIERDMVETLLKEAVENKADLVLSPLIKEYPDKKEILYNPVEFPSKEVLISGLLVEKIHHFLCGSISKRSLYTDNELVYPKDNSAEDFALMIQLAYYAESVYLFGKSVYHYRCNPSSTTGGMSKEQSMRRCVSVQKNVCLILDFLKDKSLIEQFSTEIILLKYSVREQIKTYLNDRKVYECWKNIFPEIDRQLICNRCISFKKKISYLISFFRLEPYYRPLYKLIIRR